MPANLFQGVHSVKIKTLVQVVRHTPAVWMALLLCPLLVSGCGGKNVSAAASYSIQAVPRPDVVYVYPFDVEPATVQTDRSPLASLKAALTGETVPAQQMILASQVQQRIAQEIVRQLQSRQINAVRGNALAALPYQNVLLVKGHLEQVDAGNRARRVVIGLGAGRSQLTVAVELWYERAGGAPQLIETYNASTDSGHMPGMAETLGVGAAAGRIAESAAAGGVLHGVSESTYASPLDDAKRAADVIAKQILQVHKSRGWLAAPVPQ
jgi:Domain of unknown function (DUF4410)